MQPATIAVAVALTALALAPSAAHAQNADAEALFSEGERLEAAGKIAEACHTFEASNRIEPRAGTLIRLGQCREGQGRLASAWSAYKDALTRVKDPEKRRLAELRVAALESRMSTLTVLVPDVSRIDGLVIERNGQALDAALWNRAMPLDGGVYTIGGHAPGHELWTTTVEVGDENDHASIEVPRFKELRQLVERPAGDARADVPPVVVESTPSSGLTGRRKAALVLSAGAVTAIGVATVLALNARAKEDEAYALCPSPGTPCADAATAQDLHDGARTRVLGSNVAFATAGAAAAGAVVLWVTGAPPRSSHRVSVSPFIRPGASGAAVTVRF